MLFYISIICTGLFIKAQALTQNCCANDKIYIDEETVELNINISPIEAYPAFYVDSSNVTPLYCKCKVMATYATEEDYLDIGIDWSDPYLTLTNCKSSFPVLIYQNSSIFDVSQESEICISYELNQVDQDWVNYTVSIYYIQSGMERQVIPLNETTPIVPFTYPSLSEPFSITATSTNNYPIEFHYLIRSYTAVPDDSNGYNILFNSYNLSNSTSLLFGSNSNGPTKLVGDHLTIAPQSNAEDIFQYVFRIPAIHARNCNTTKNLLMPWSLNQSYNASIKASEFGACKLSISPTMTMDSFSNLFIRELKYIGDGEVRVVVNADKDYELFAFNWDTAVYYEELVVHGELITFIVPANGELYIDYQSLDLMGSNKLEWDFDDYDEKVIQSSNYPSSGSPERIFNNIKCNNGSAHFTITVVFAEISFDGCLKIIYDNIILYSNGTFINQTHEFVSTNVVIDYEPGIEDTHGILIRYTATSVPPSEPSSSSNSMAVRIIIGISVTLIVGVSVSVVCCYFYQIKQKEKKFDFILKIVKESKEKATEEEKTEPSSNSRAVEFLIQPRNLRIHFEKPLGVGVSGNVFEGFLYGASPLTNSIKNLETQKFQDCSVAVKVPGGINSDDSEQLQHEIDCLKKVGYNEHVACMLGVGKVEEKQVIVFEMAKINLLTYVKGFNGKGMDEAPVKIFYSILWQVAKGMQYLVFKNIIHRDLAARNILLTESLNSKISDFGLACFSDASTRFLPKKFPAKWFSLEALTEFKFSEKSDVWSFGILMYEVFNFGQPFYIGLNTKEELVEFLESGRRLNRLESADETTFETMSACWREDPEERPDFDELENRIHDVLERMTFLYGYIM